MSRIDDLKPDQRAALQLLLKQGRSYEEIAQMLRIETRAVRERARAALDALGPEDVQDLPLEDQDDVADYLLGQQSASRRAQTRGLLEQSPPARAWARTVASELRPLAGDTLPEIPAEAAESYEAFEALEARTQHRERTEQSSRVGGAILLGAIALLVVGLILFLTNALGEDEDDGGERAGNGSTQTQTQGTQPADGAAGTPVAQATLNPPSGGGGDNSPTGVAIVFKQGNEYLVGVEAEKMRPTTQSSFYAVWLVGPAADRRRFVGFGNQVDEQGQMAGARSVKYDPSTYRDVLITRETQERPREPGEIILRGRIQKVPEDQQQGGAAPPAGEGQGEQGSG